MAMEDTFEDMSEVKPYLNDLALGNPLLKTTATYCLKTWRMLEKQILNLTKV